MTRRNVDSAGDREKLQDDFLAVAAGIADVTTQRRVLAAALTDADLRAQLAFLEEPEIRGWEKEANALSEVSRTKELREKMAAMTLQYVRASAAVPSVAEALAPIRDMITQVTQVAERALIVARELITLPCLAPAMAAPGPLDFLTVQSQSVTTGEGVRIEFQQLPPVGWEMTTKPHLRVVVDASALEEPFGGENGYNTAFVTLEEGGGVGNTPTLPDLHTLVVPLNAQGLGFTDANAIPPPKAACRLVAVTLSHIAN